MNYVPELQSKRIQRVEGTIRRMHNCLHIHLDSLDEKIVLEFRLDQFYKKLKQQKGGVSLKCSFTGYGINIGGVLLYREGEEIILEGDYSEEYFEVRRLLYDFL